MNVERVTHADDALVAALARLVPQLSPKREPPGRAELEELLAAPGTSLFVARDGDAVLGMLTLIVYRVPTGMRGWIHDVVVDDAARGRGAGEALTRGPRGGARRPGRDRPPDDPAAAGGGKPPLPAARLRAARDERVRLAARLTCPA